MVMVVTDFLFLVVGGLLVALGALISKIRARELMLDLLQNVSGIVEEMNENTKKIGGKIDWGKIK